MLTKEGVMRERLDSTDFKIIGLLQKDGRMPSSEIAKITNVSEATVRYRLKKLIDGGFIQIVAAGNPIKLGFGIAANIGLYTESLQIDKIVTELKKLKHLSYIAQMTGERAIELETFVESIDELHQLLLQIENIEGIKRIETSFIRRIIRERFDWGTPGGDGE
ncbi:MAG: Lrp/AsnC family transcriptional regulator [Deltaproteobacteria bacterium]|nr:MAG: Lrp/AsnC family transcriptional regulator [Deltaproteobacteria bacterium]